MDDEIQELESYNLFQEISDTFTLFSGLINHKEDGLIIKDTFLITKEENIIFQDGKSEEDMNLILQWFQDKKLDLLEKIPLCVKASQDNLTKFKSENPSIKEDLKIRLIDLKKATNFLTNLILEKPLFSEFEKLKEGPEFNSEYGGINVKETKYFLI